MTACCARQWHDKRQQPSLGCTRSWHQAGHVMLRNIFTARYTTHIADWRLHKVLLLLYGEEELNKKKIWGWVVWDKRIRICSFLFYQRHAGREKSLWCRNINMLPSRFSRYFHLTLLRSLSLCIYLLHSSFPPTHTLKTKCRWGDLRVWEASRQICIHSRHTEALSNHLWDLISVFSHEWT